MEHIFTPGEQQMRERVQNALREAANLLEEPVTAEQVHTANRRAREASAGLVYLQTRAAGVPAPKQGD